MTVTVPPRARTGTAVVRDPLGRAAPRYFARCDTCGWLFGVHTSNAALMASLLHEHPSVILEVNPRG